jgi:hypothetical protein
VFLCGLTMSSSGYLPHRIARCARAVIPARTACLVSSHGRFKRLLGTEHRSFKPNFDLIAIGVAYKGVR